MVTRPSPHIEESLEDELDSPRAGRPRDESRDHVIMDAALELVATVGYDAMSIESIAQRAGVSKATIYRRWPGKAEVVADAIRRKDPGGLDPEDTGSLRGDLMAMVSTLFANIDGADGGLVCGLAMAVRSDAELGQLLSAHKHDHKERVSSLILSRAQARGELGTGADLPNVMDTAAGMALFRVMSGQPLDPEFADYLVDRILIPTLRS